MLGATQSEPPLPAMSTSVRFGRDRAHGAGPLAAVADALADMHAETALIVAGDAPHVPAALLGAMRDALAAGDADVLALRDGLAVRPMPIAVRCGTAGREAASLVAHGILRLGVLVESAALRLDHRDEAWWRRWDPDGEWRRDVDVPADLKGGARGGAAGPG